jgi:hypothetical protein
MTHLCLLRLLSHVVMYYVDRRRRLGDRRQITVEKCHRLGDRRQITVERCRSTRAQEADYRREVSYHGYPLMQ